MPEFSVSTWSLHRALGPIYQPAADDSSRIVTSEPWGPGSWSLLDVPAEMARRGITHLEICHFHFPRTDDGYLQELKGKIEESGIQLFSILIDRGDISNPDDQARQADIDWISGWIEIAGKLGAKNVRVIGGDAPPDSQEGIDRSIAALNALSEVAKAQGVRVMTENFRQLTSRPEAVNAILDGLGGRVGLCADFGNFGGPSKYDDLAAILPRADSVHAKADFNDQGEIQRDDFNRCLALARDAGFNGPYTLIFEGPQMEWDGVSILRQEILATA